MALPMPLRRSIWRGVAASARILLRLSGRRAGLVLVYHAVEPRSGDPERELVPPHELGLFEAQLRHLVAHYRPVAAEELVVATATRRRGGRFPVAITFDDDLASHERHAAPILASLRIPATFFLTGATLERPFSFWWQRLQRAVDLGLDGPVAGVGIHERAAEIEAMPPAEQTALAERLEAMLGPDPDDSGLRAELVAALARAGFEIGFHTLHHHRLTCLDDNTLAQALSEGRARLESVVGRPLTAIAYPHGKADARVARAARRAGFRSGFTGRYEPVTPASEPLLLGRMEPTFTPGLAFAVQLVRMLARAHR